MNQFVPLVVLERVEETPDSTSFELGVPREAKSRFSYSPGQHITVRVDHPATLGVQRSYSLSSNPGFDTNLRITVKRCASGFVSNHLCDAIRPGDLLHASPPRGDFVPESAQAAGVVAFAAGSGISPIYSMIKHWLFDTQLHVRLIHIHRDLQDGIFMLALTELSKQFPERLTYVQHLTHTQGRPSTASFEPSLQGEVGGVYACGPTAFVESVRAASTSVGIGADRFNAEEFYSDLGEDEDQSHSAYNGAGAPRTHDLRVAIGGGSLQMPWPEGTKLLDLLLANGVKAPYSCKRGICSACQCMVTSGEAIMLKSDGLLPDEIAAGRSLACQLLPVTQSLSVEFDV